jgi:hypothetical protein
MLSDDFWSRWGFQWGLTSSLDHFVRIRLLFITHLPQPVWALQYSIREDLLEVLLFFWPRHAILYM